jgi:hypothetical protein
VGNPAGKSPFGRPRNRWEDKIKTDLKSGGKAWTVMDRGVTCECGNEPSGYIKCGKYLVIFETIT